MKFLKDCPASEAEVIITDGGNTYYYTWEGDLTVQQLADDFLAGYDLNGGTNPVHFILTLASDEEDMFVSGAANGSAEFHDLLPQARSTWTA